MTNKNPQYERDSNNEISSYIRELFCEEDIVLKNTLKSIEDNNLPAINVNSDEAKIVQVLLKLQQTKTMVEVGTLVGYSAIWFARGLAEGGKLFTFEKDSKTAEVAKNNIKNSDVANIVEVIEGNALEKLKEIENFAPFDAIFIDADKGGYCDYLDWAENNLKKGGLIIGDNTFLFGHMYGAKDAKKQSDKAITAMKKFNERIADKSKYDGVIIPTIEGLTIGIKKF